jgi:hypothetical protein
LRWADEKFFGGLVVKRRDLKVATMCRYNGLITAHVERKKKVRKKKQKNLLRSGTTTTPKIRKGIKIKNNTYIPPQKNLE